MQIDTRCIPAEELRRKYSGDKNRPAYHFLGPANWMNDPNGLIQWKGIYHLYYQHNPHGALWGDMHWGHAASQDLVHWQDLPIAVAPDQRGLDRSGVWSGCALVLNGLPAMLYTARDGDSERVCLATSLDDLRTLEKFSGNPVISGPPNALHDCGFRDPFAWYEVDRWKMIVSGGTLHGPGCIFLYESTDCIQWTYLGKLYEGSEKDPGWECGNFLRLGNQYMLIISDMGDRRVHAYIGNYDGLKFTPKHHQVVDGGNYYAPQAFMDDSGRVILIGWITEARADSAITAAGWAGVQSLPRCLSLDPMGQLVMKPVSELITLRKKSWTWDHFNEIKPDIPLPVVGDQLEINLASEPGKGSLDLFLRCSPDVVEQTIIHIDRGMGKVEMDRTQSSLDENTGKEMLKVDIDTDPNQPLTLQVFMDHSVIEVFVNQLYCLTGRIYPQRFDSLGLKLNRHSETRLRKLEIHELDSIWPDIHFPGESHE